MIIKFAIIAVILGAGSIIFASQLLNFFPETATTVDLVKKDLNTITENTLQNVNDNIEDIKEKSNDFLTQGFAGKLSNPLKDQDLSEMGTKNDNESITSIEGYHGGNNGKITHNNIQTSNTDSKPSTIAPANPQILTFETLSLTTAQGENGMIMLRYDDTSGKTTSVSVTLQNSEKEIFSGVFFSSMFETLVLYPSNAPYFIDMIVEHEEYGTITSSVFNPGENEDTTINGVFSKS